MTLDPIYQQPLAYLDAAFLTCSVYELLRSLGLEVKFVWQGPRNAIRVCYVLTRYICIVSFALAIMTDAPDASAVQTVSPLATVTQWLSNVNILFVQVIFSLRTWMLLGQNRKMILWFSVLTTLLWGTTFGVLAIVFTILGGTGYVYFISLTIFYLVMTILVTVKANKTRRELNTSFVRLAYAQGLAYYVLLVVTSLSALVIVALRGDVVFVERAIQFIFTYMACRMSLSILAPSSHTPIALDNGGLNLSQLQNTTIPLGDVNVRPPFGRRARLSIDLSM